MTKDGPRKALLVVVLTALLCSTLVSAAVVMLRPIQMNNRLLERSSNIMQLTGLLQADEVPDDEEMLALFKSLDTRMIEISEGRFDDTNDPHTFDQRRAVNDPKLGLQIPQQMDVASLGRRSRFAPVYMVWDGAVLNRMILPVRGTGMWSMMYGYIAVEADLRTIAGMNFYEQNETPGLGDQIAHEYWLQKWRGLKIYDDQLNLAFRVSEDNVQPGSEAGLYEVDALSGATVTANAVTALMHYWFGPHGYGPFLDHLREQPPTPAGEES